jgi:hypothetical protein
VNVTEERLRAAARALAETIPQGSAPPLRLPSPRRRRRWPWGGRRRGPGRRNWAGWAAPVAAAAAVAAIAAGSLAITHPGGPGGRTASASAPGPGLDGVPRYYAQTAYMTRHAAIKSTAGGRLLAVVTAPGPYVFTLVTAAADDRTFVFGAEATAGALNWRQSGPGLHVAASTELTAFFVLRFDPGQRGQRLEPLHVPLQLALVTGAALSPDARELAVATWAGNQLNIQVFTLATGVVKTWYGSAWSEPNDDQAGTETVPNANWMSWADGDRTLAVDWPGPAGHTIHPPGWPGWPRQWAQIESVSEIDTAGSGGNLAADSTAPLPAAAIVFWPGNAVLTPDGDVLVDSAWANGVTTGLSQIPLAEYSARTGAAMGRFGRTPASSQGAQVASQVLWANVNGSVLIVTESGQQNQTAGVLTRTGFTPLSGLTLSPGEPDSDNAVLAW